MKCNGKTADGKRCRKAAMNGRETCQWHGAREGSIRKMRAARKAPLVPVRTATPEERAVVQLGAALGALIDAKAEAAVRRVLKGL